MKKLLLILSTVFAFTLVQTSCGTTNNLSNTIKTVQKINNISKTASTLSNVLSNTLDLDNAQKSSLTGIFTDYITGTNSINSLANSNMSQYAAKLAGLNTETLSKMKGIMNAAQYAKLLGLGGSSKSSTSLLKNLVGGQDLTPDAMSVLAGLLL